MTSVFSRYLAGAARDGAAYWVSTIVVGLVLSLGAGTVAVADPVARATEGCTPIYSLQKRQCEVEHVYQCAAGFVVVSVEEGVTVGMEFTGADGQIEGFQGVDRPGSMTVQGVADQMSIAALRETGAETFEVVIDFDFSGTLYRDLPASGEVTLDGGIRTIGDVRFATGLAKMKIDFPASLGLLRSQWEVLLPEGHDVILTGESVSQFGKRLSLDETEVRQVLRPSDDGFLVNQGLYDCGEES